MKHLSYILSCLLIGCSAIPETPQSVDIVVDDFGLYDQNGEFHTLYEHSDASAIVLFVQGNGCPIVRNAVHSLNAIRDEYAPKGVQFLMLNANLQDDRDVRVRGTEFLPGNRAAMHHALARVIYPKGHKLKTVKKNRWLDGIFASYVPGMDGVMLPRGTAQLLPKGSKLQFQVHYTTTGRPRSG